MPLGSPSTMAPFAKDDARRLAWGERSCIGRGSRGGEKVGAQMKLGDISGLFINLDRSEDRRARMEEALATHGLDKVGRFSARVGDDRKRGISRNELGCFLSHQAIIEAIGDDRHFLIMEDDIQFPAAFSDYVGPALANCEEEEWDILFLTQMIAFTNVGSIYALLRQRRQAGDIRSPAFTNFSTFDCKNIYASCAAAYVVRAGAAGKVADLLTKMADAGYPCPLDIVFLRAINTGLLKARYVFPYLVGLQTGLRTTLDDRRDEGNHELFVDITNLFAAGGDIDSLRLDAFDALHNRPFDAEAFVATQILYRRLSR